MNNNDRQSEEKTVRGMRSGAGLRVAFGLLFWAAVGANAAPVAPAVKLTVAETKPTQATLLHVTVHVSGAKGAAVPTGTVAVTSGKYASAASALVSGSVVVEVPALLLKVGTDTLTAAYTPDKTGAVRYTSAKGTATVKVVAVTAKLAPTVTVTPAASSVTSLDALGVTVKVAGPAGDLTPAGTVALTSRTKKLGSATLSAGAARIQLAAGTLPAGADTLTAAYTPDTVTGAVYKSATGAATETVTPASLVTVNQAGTDVKVSSQLMGMNMAVWFDPTDPHILPAFKTAGIAGVRWPGGSDSDLYHWATNTGCDGSYTNSNATFQNFVADLAARDQLDVALTANYGSNAACNGGGDPSEAAAWITQAKTLGANVTHMTVGNEEYGGWEEDLHTLPHDPATYAQAVATGYYPAIKAANKDVLVGVDVNPGLGWDETVLAQARYDFVEYHFYPQAPGKESDSYLVGQAAQDLTATLKTIQKELKTAGKPNTPIFVGEIGSVYTDPGKQSTSITQALYAGQVLGELMNQGIDRAAWWIGFGGCNDATGPNAGNFSASLYGWQNFGGYMVFSDGTPEYGCENATPVADGTLLPTARAYQLFQQVAVEGESVLAAAVTGDPADVRAYAATHAGGTALVLFNLNQTTAQTVRVKLSKQTATTGATLLTYSKDLYDQSQPKNNVWAGPVGRTLGAQKLPLTLTLAPWSMNLLILK